MYRISRPELKETVESGSPVKPEDAFVGSRSSKIGVPKPPEPPQSNWKNAVQRYREHCKSKSFLQEQRKFQAHIQSLEKNDPKLKELEERSSNLQARRKAVFESLEKLENAEKPGFVRSLVQSVGLISKECIVEMHKNRLLKELWQLQESLGKYKKVFKNSNQELSIVNHMIEQVQIKAQSTERLRLNQAEYERRVAKLRDLMKSEGNTNDFSRELSELEAFDKKLRKEYGIWDPYPSEGVAQKVYDRATNWGLLSSSSRPTPNQLLIEFSLARAKVEPTTISMYSEFVRNFDTKKMLSSLYDLALQHPTFAAEVAGEISHMVSLLSGNPTAGATLLTALYRKRRENIVFELLNGSNERSFQKECENPLTREQIALMDLLKRMPRVIGMTQGALGLSLGGIAGHAIAGPVGGALVGGLQVEAQRVLAESMSREVEVWASSLSSLAMTTDWVQTYRGINSLLDGFSIQEVIRLATMLSLPISKERNLRAATEKFGNFYRNVREKGFDEAVKISALKDFSKKTASEIQIGLTINAIFFVNVLKFLTAINTGSEDFGKKVPGLSEWGFVLDKMILADTSSEALIGFLKKHGSSAPAEYVESTKRKLVHGVAESVHDKFRQLIALKGDLPKQAAKLMEIFKEATNGNALLEALGEPEEE